MLVRAPLTPEQRRMHREERKARRLEKRAERRMRRGLPPELRAARLNPTRRIWSP